MNLTYSLWLVPQKDDEIYLSKIVNQLSEKYEAPTFVPHLTILGDIEIDLENLKKIVDQTFRKVKPFAVNITAVKFTENFRKTLFIEFEINNTLKNLFNELSEKTDKRSITTFTPHLSLIYKIMPNNDKEKIINNLYIKDQIIFGGIWINDNGNLPDGPEYVKSWKTLYKKYL